MLSRFLQQLERLRSLWIRHQLSKGVSGFFLDFSLLGPNREHSLEIDFRLGTERVSNYLLLERFKSLVELFEDFSNGGEVEVLKVESLEDVLANLYHRVDYQQESLVRQNFNPLALELGGLRELGGNLGVEHFEKVDALLNF